VSVDFGFTCIIRRLDTLTWLRPCVRSVHLKLFSWIQQNGEVSKRAKSFLVQFEFLYSDLEWFCACQGILEKKLRTFWFLFV